MEIHITSFSYHSMLLFAAVTVQLAAAEVYIVRMAEPPVVTYTGSVSGLKATATAEGLRPDISSAEVQSYISYLHTRQDKLLSETLGTGSYTKLYSFHYLINGFVIQMTPVQAQTLAGSDGVTQVEKDSKVQKMTTHTPEFLGLPDAVWPKVSGPENAGEGIVIGMVDTGIDPTHPSFSSNTSRPWDPVEGFSGECEVTPDFPLGSCNGKIVAARHFAASASHDDRYNASLEHASPFDVDGHGSHTAATAAGNLGVPVIVKGYNYGIASGMAPRARIAVYKALYSFGGAMSDVVAAIDQAVQDGVHILSLSLGPEGLPSGISTFLNVMDVELLLAVKAGVFVVQAAGNNGPRTGGVLSFSPWITSAAAATTDRTYSNFLRLGNDYSIEGVGLSPPTSNYAPIPIVSATDAFSANKSFFSVDECQQSELYSRQLVQNSILLCQYTLNFVYGGSSVKQVSDTAKTLGAEGFVLIIDPAFATTPRVDPIPLELPGIVVTDRNASLAILQYYNESTTRDSAGAVKSFGAHASIGDGRSAEYGAVAPVVAFFSSRGPDFSNSLYQFADVMKPDIMAPGFLVWSAWSPTGFGDRDFSGENFALISGTSMATPHIAGIAALIKQAHPDWSPAAITSALMTSADVYDKLGQPLLAQNSSTSDSLAPATIFDFGAGAVNPQSALDPGLVFGASFEDYVSFLCAVPGIDPNSVRYATSAACGVSPLSWASDLNKPYVTIGNLVGSRTVGRTLTNVGGTTESYRSICLDPIGVKVTLNPESFTIKQGETTPFFITVTATNSTSSFSFGLITLIGSSGHLIRIPLAIFPSSVEQ